MPVLIPAPDPEGLLPQRPARELLGWSEATMLRYRNNPKYRHFNFPEAIIINGRCYWRRADILAWIASHAARSHSGFANGRNLAQEGVAR